MKTEKTIKTKWNCLTFLLAELLWNISETKSRDYLWVGECLWGDVVHRTPSPIFLAGAPFYAFLLGCIGGEARGAERSRCLPGLPGNTPMTSCHPHPWLSAHVLVLWALLRSTQCSALPYPRPPLVLPLD